MDMQTNEASGQHCLQYTHPTFRQRASQGCNIVVAGQAFGCGSSREQAVMALLGESPSRKPTTSSIVKYLVP